MLRLPAIERLADGADTAAMFRQRRGDGGRRLTADRKRGQARRAAQLFARLNQTHVTDGHPAQFGALGVDDVPADMVHGYWIGGEEERLALPGAPGAVPAAGAAFVDADDAVANVQHCFLTQRPLVDCGRNKRIALVWPARGASHAIDATDVAAGDVVVHAVRHVLESDRHAGRLVILQARDRDDLVHHARDDHRQVRAVNAVVTAMEALVYIIVAAGVLDGSEAHGHELIRIVPDDVRVAHLIRIAAVDGELRIVVTGSRRVPAAAVELAARHQALVAGVAEFVGITLEDDDVALGNAAVLVQGAHGLGDDGRR